MFYFQLFNIFASIDKLKNVVVTVSGNIHYKFVNMDSSNQRIHFAWQNKNICCRAVSGELDYQRER